MKARVKATGVIVDVKCLDNNNWYDKLNDEYYLSYDLDFNSSDMPSEQRMRYELTKTAMHAILTGDFYKRYTIRDDLQYGGVANEAINIADEIIKQLKESEVEK